MRLLALVAATSAIALAACGNDRNESHADDALDSQVCTKADVGESFNHQTSGDFSPENLADLGDRPGTDRASLRSMGMTTGHFVYWKDAAGKPPFEPPMDVVCQVMAFQSEGQARTFVAELSAGLAPAMVIGRLPVRGHEQVTELTVPGGTARVFSVSIAGDSADPLEVNIAFVADGRYVRVVAIGAPSTSVGSNTASALLERVAARQR